MPSIVALDEGHEGSRPTSAKSCFLAPEGKPDRNHDVCSGDDASLAESILSLDSHAWSRPTRLTAWEEAQKAEDARRAAQIRLSEWLEELPTSQLAPEVFVPWESTARRRERITTLLYRFDRLFLWRRTAPRLIIGAPLPKTRDEPPDTTVLGIQTTHSVCVATSSKSHSCSPNTNAVKTIARNIGHLQPANAHQASSPNVQSDLVGVGCRLNALAPSSNNPLGKARTSMEVLSSTPTGTPLHQVQSQDSTSSTSQDEPSRKRTKVVHPETKVVRSETKVVRPDSANISQDEPSRKRTKVVHLDSASISQDEPSQKRTKVVHPDAGDTPDTCEPNPNSPASSKDSADATVPATSSILTLKRARPHNETVDSEHHHSPARKRRKVDLLKPLCDEDFAAWAGHCWFYAHNRAAYSSQAWSSCRRQKKAISHITTHAEDVHGLSRGQGSKHSAQIYLTRCAQKDPTLEGNTPCCVCCAVDTWTTGQFDVPDHEGPAVCLRCYNILATKRDLFAHLSEESPCSSRRMKLSKQGKARILYTAFCSSTEPPRGMPSDSPLPVTAHRNEATPYSMNVEHAMRADSHIDQSEVAMQPKTVDSVLSHVPGITPQLPFHSWQLNAQDAIIAETSSCTGQTWVSTETLLRPCPPGAGPPTAFATRFADLGLNLDQHPPPSSTIQVPPNWGVATDGRNPSMVDEGYGTLDSFGGSLSRSVCGQQATHMQTSTGVVHAPFRFPPFPPFPLADQFEFGHHMMFNHDVYGPEYARLLDGDGMAGGDSSFGALLWQIPNQYHDGTVPANAQQPPSSAYPPLG